MGSPKEEPTARNHYVISMTSSCNQDVQVGSPKEEQRAARRPSLELAISRDPEHLRDPCAIGHVHAISRPSAINSNQRQSAIRSTYETPAHVGTIHQQSAIISGRQRSSAPISRTQPHSAALSRTQSHSVALSRTQSHSVALSRTQSQSPAQVGGMPITQSACNQHAISMQSACNHPRRSAACT